MTQDEIIRMARESGVYLTKIGYEFDIDDLERFAALVAAHWQKIHQQEMSMMSELCADRILEEREACARECWEFYSIEGIAQKCNAAIRARSNNAT